MNAFESVLVSNPNNNYLRKKKKKKKKGKKTKYKNTKFYCITTLK